jgi:glyoxylase-like metal-dependent hydrolase (beta-lactamase superfamily II)
VDTHATEVEARRVVEQVRRLGVGDVVAIVNTHQHFDHTFGNVVFSEAYDGPPIIAHEEAAAELARSAPPLQEFARTDDSDPRHADIAATRVLLPTETFSSARAVDLGNLMVELVHPGRGHTTGDCVVRAGDADLLFAGDLVEESAVRSGVPGYGDDCYPMEWPASLDLVIGLLTPDSVVVPGHGLPVDKDFVDEQRSAIGVVAETIRDLASLRSTPGTHTFRVPSLLGRVGKGCVRSGRGIRAGPARPSRESAACCAERRERPRSGCGAAHADAE